MVLLGCFCVCDYFLLNLWRFENKCISETIFVLSMFMIVSAFPQSFTRFSEVLNPSQLVYFWTNKHFCFFAAWVFSSSIKLLLVSIKFQNKLF